MIPYFANYYFIILKKIVVITCIIFAIISESMLMAWKELECLGKEILQGEQGTVF